MVSAPHSEAKWECVGQFVAMTLDDSGALPLQLLGCQIVMDPGKTGIWTPGETGRRSISKGHRNLVKDHRMPVLFA